MWNVESFSPSLVTPLLFNTVLVVLARAMGPGTETEIIKFGKDEGNYLYSQVTDFMPSKIQVIYKA